MVNAGKRWVSSVDSVEAAQRSPAGWGAGAELGP